jgi:hypothetical protein
MRKKPTNQAQIQGRKTLEALDSQLQEALRRITRLERMVLENGLEPPYEPPAKRERGRPCGLPLEDLKRRTSSLIVWLEDNWPEISRGLNAAKSEQKVADALKSGRRGTYVFQPPFFQHPGRFAADCWDFIQSKRYRHNPRNLAAAMAGLPEIGWKRSFDLCSKYAANCHPVGYRAYRDYLRRRFHERFRKLTAASTIEEVATILGGSRSKDHVIRYLSENPGKVLYWLECGQPGNIHMHVEPIP